MCALIDVEPPTLPAAASPRGLGRRLLHSSLLEALAYPHGVDRYVELVRPLLLKRDVRAEVTAVRQQTPKSVTLTLCPNENWRGLRAGQFVGVSVEIDGVRETRPYSPAGSQHAAAGALELTVSTHPEGRVSRYLRKHARPGMIVGLTQADGEFVLPDQRPERVLLISGGSGITPVMAMLRTLCDEGFAGEIGFLNYARSRELALYGVRARSARRPPRAAPRRPRLHARARSAAQRVASAASTCDAVIGEHSSAATFVCGPPALIDSVRAVWAQDGLAEPAVETFTPPALTLRHRRRRGPRQLRRQRTRGRQQRPAAARAGRGRRARPRARMPHGHLQHVQLPQDGRHRAERHHRRDLDRQGRADPDLRVGAGRRRRARPVTTDLDKEPIMSTAAPDLTPEQLEAFGQELDAIRARVVADLGERDADYINKVIRAQRGLEVAGRGLLFLGFLPPAWIGGTAALSLSKILDNMEIGHNVMHGQYDWMNDPRLDGKTFEWDTACPGDQWRHSHNYMHHTHTNIVGKDRDIGYGMLRMSEDQPWHPYYLGNPLYAALLAIFFQYGVALHDLETERIAAGETTLAREARHAGGHLGARCAARRSRTTCSSRCCPAPRSRSCWPATRPRTSPATCGRSRSSSAGTSPTGRTSSPRRRPRTRRAGSGTTASCSARPTSPAASCSTSSRATSAIQIEHHLFPDLPAHRYAEISVEVREIRERYGIPYNTGPLHRQFGSVVRKIVKLALPPLPGRGGSAAARRGAAEGAGRSGS